MNWPPDCPAHTGEGGAQPDAPREPSASRPAPAPGVELVVGLGNPRERYAATRHNLGYRVVDELARRLEAAPWSHRPLCDVTSVPLGARLLLAKPLTFMNRSGAAVAWLLDHLDLEPRQMLVVLDDADLDLGALRLRRSGGPGSHNGLRDICERFGTAFPRLRLGVRGRDGWQDLADWVLSPFTDDEQPLALQLVARGADAVETAVREGLDPAMSRFNGPASQTVADR